MKNLFLLLILVFGLVFVLLVSASTVSAIPTNYTSINCIMAPAGTNGYFNLKLFIDDSEKKLYREGFFVYPGKTEIFNNKLIKITNTDPYENFRGITIDRVTGEISIKISQPLTTGVSFITGKCSKVL